MKIFNENAIVKSNKLIADNVYEAFIYSPKISEISKPGQFINILPSDSWPNMMRRPMSIASQKDNKISIIYKVFGEGTDIMSKWRVGEEVDIIGPLGNTWNRYEKQYPILIGGGVGIAPILNLHNHLNKLSIKHSLICGAQRKDEHFLNHNPDKNIFLSTDNESFGIQGNVINALEIIRNEINHEIKIFSCGPHGMLKAIFEYAMNYDYKCQLAVETIMACGIGICQGCTIVKNESNCKNTYREKFALACIDGPVFDIEELDKNAF